MDTIHIDWTTVLSIFAILAMPISHFQRAGVVNCTCHLSQEWPHVGCFIFHNLLSWCNKGITSDNRFPKLYHRSILTPQNYLLTSDIDTGLSMPTVFV